MTERWQLDQARREKAVEKAVQLADRIIMDASDGSNEETNYLTARVAEEFIKKALIPLSTALSKRDLREEKQIERSRSGETLSGEVLGSSHGPSMEYEAYAMGCHCSICRP